MVPETSPFDGRRRAYLIGFVVPSGLGVLVSLITVGFLFAGDSSSSAHETGSALGQLFFLFLAVAVVVVFAGMCAGASGLLFYLCRRNPHAVWVGWIPWTLAAALIGMLALGSC